MNEIVTEDRLLTLQREIKVKVGCDDGDSRRLALRVMNYFGFNDEMIDNVLDIEDRKLFYFLQDLEVLSSWGEEMQLISGRNWRIFYWSLNINRIEGAEKRRLAPEIDIYHELPDANWSDHSVQTN